MRKVYKYGTGQIIPEGAVYLTTLVEKDITDRGDYNWPTKLERNTFVWHYFLVEVEGDNTNE